MVHQNPEMVRQRKYTLNKFEAPAEKILPCRGGGDSGMTRQAGKHPSACRWLFMPLPGVVRAVPG